MICYDDNCALCASVCVVVCVCVSVHVYVCVCVGGGGGGGRKLVMYLASRLLGMPEIDNSSGGFSHNAG